MHTVCNAGGNKLIHVSDKLLRVSVGNMTGGTGHDGTGKVVQVQTLPNVTKDAL